MSIFVAIIFLLAFTPGLGYIPLGVIRITIVHIPVIIGSILLGPKYGAVLGAMFGLTSLINNTITPVITSFVFTPFYTIGEEGGSLLSLVVCFVPRILVGIVPYYVYRAFMRRQQENRKKQNAKEVIALAIAGVAGSLTNTLLVMNFIYLFFGQRYASATGHAIEALYTVILGIIGTNGVPEAIGAGILTVGVGQVLLRIRRQ